MADDDKRGKIDRRSLLTGVAIVVFIVLLPRGIVGGLIEAARRRAYLAPKRGEAP